MPWLVWFALIGLCVILIAIVYGLARTKAYQEFAAAQETYERAYPTFVVTLN